ncbi:MAG: bidirectional hydrogenase complex protein HoxE [Cyanobacteriota bacterium]|nr:bidirectional hydrogenase complex protein HoxE [Cyanobacteriota bacterium]
MTPTTARPTQPKDDKRFKRLDMAMKRQQYRQDALIEILHQAQGMFGYLEEEVLVHIARALKLPLSQVYGVATFYHLFSLKPSGVHSCVVCMGTACYVKGSGDILAAIEEEYDLSAGETTSDGQTTVLTARCIGACGLAPAVVFDGTVAAKQTSESVLEKVKTWEQAVTSNP